MSAANRGEGFNPQSTIHIPFPSLHVLTFTMDAQATLDAEDRLAEFFVLPLFARESAWAEIAEDLVVALEPKPPLALPAPVTLRWPLLRLGAGLPK